MMFYVLLFYYSIDLDSESKMIYLLFICCLDSKKNKSDKKPCVYNM